MAAISAKDSLLEGGLCSLDQEQWQFETEAYIRYSQKRICDPDLKDGTEVGVACIYEYAREVVRGNAGRTEFLEIFLSHSPFWRFLDETPTAVNNFCRHPWLTLSKEKRRNIISDINFSYGENDQSTLHVPALWTLPFTDLLHRFTTAARSNFDEANAALDKGEIERFARLTHTPACISAGPSCEFVIVTIDYGLKKNAVLKQIDNWLDTRSEQFASHAVELTGERFFRDHLRDLANWRLHNHLGMKKLDLLKSKEGKRPDLLNATGSYSQAKARSRKFLSFLPSTTFTDLKELEIAFRRQFNKKR